MWGAEWKRIDLVQEDRLKNEGGGGTAVGAKEAARDRLAQAGAVMAAAFLHALWNALIKVGTSKAGGMVILSIAEVPIGLTIALMRPWPPSQSGVGCDNTGR